MNLAEYLSPEAVLPTMTAATRDEVLAELVRPLRRLHPEIQALDITAVLREREDMASTAVGNGVAIPHGKIPGLSRLALAVGLNRGGVAFDTAAPQALCHIFFCILAPPEELGTHLLVLAQIARRAKDPVFRSDVLLAENADSLWQIVTEP